MIKPSKEVKKIEQLLTDPWAVDIQGTRFEHISAQDLTTTLLQINQRPLKILDWQTPYQVMLTNLSKNSD
ncbi:hypothetical protein EFM17_03375 [Lactobacillus delbrueckii]|nr:hypothetical protein [Lactobacillus delbrueckii]